MGPDRGVSHSAAIGAGHMPPHFGGGSLSSPLIFLPYRHYGRPIISGLNTAELER